MQAISRSKHRHLVDALLHLEDLLSRDIAQDRDRFLASEYRSQLEVMHLNYEKQLLELYDRITEYEELFQKAKIQFLSPKLKELKKQVQPETTMFSLLTENIKLSYGT